jgi:hypothetical protein
MFSQGKKCKYIEYWGPKIGSPPFKSLERFSFGAAYTELLNWGSTFFFKK